MVRIAEFVGIGEFVGFSGFSGVLGGSRGFSGFSGFSGFAGSDGFDGFDEPRRLTGPRSIHVRLPKAGAAISASLRSRPVRGTSPRIAYRVSRIGVLAYWRIARRSAPPNASHAATARIGLLARACAPPAGEAGGALRPCRRAHPPSSPAHCTDASSITSPGARAGIVCAASRRAAAFAAQGRAT
ncbi:hypothetical protein DO71_6079 [Burkholderia pseudomallei]|nr:hypothetical protein DO71_6079 [Burkholderia pseudomallei]